jgi:hypothetical protein
MIEATVYEKLWNTTVHCTKKETAAWVEKMEAS